MGGRIAFFALLALAGCSRHRIIPQADHHRHLMSPAAVRHVSAPGRRPEEPLSARQFIGMLDEAGIRYAVVLSGAYYFDGVDQLGLPGVYEKVRAENDWTAGQVSQFPNRLVAFCSLNPVADHALPELRRCAESRKFPGVKLHFAPTGTTITDPDHLGRVRAVFRAANDVRLPILAHVAAREGYGRGHAEIIVNRIVPEAPDVPVIIAHLWGGGAVSEPALAVYADAVSSGHPAAKNLYFELAQASLVAGSGELYEMLARRIRQIGLNRVYYGSDGQFGGASPRAVWSHFRTNVPLTDDELRVIASNVAPLVRR